MAKLPSISDRSSTAVQPTAVPLLCHHCVLGTAPFISTVPTQSYLLQEIDTELRARPIIEAEKTVYIRREGAIC